MALEDANKSANEEAVAAGLDATLKSLFDAAAAVAAHSYSPYSGFKVGAALKLSNGEIVTGTNVENVSYGLTICAERAAVVQAVSRFGPKIRIEAVAIANPNNQACPPCGGCRQVIAEFIEPEAPVMFPASHGVRVMPFSHLLPLAQELKLK
jgi:cytidine deaminase